MSSRPGLKILNVTSTVAVAVAAVLVATATAPALGDSSRPARPDNGKVSALVDSSPGRSVIHRGITIHSSRRAAENNAAVVYSVRLSHPRTGDRIKVVGTAAPSYCSSGDVKNDRPGSPCRLEKKRHGKRDYRVRIKTILYSARSASQPSRPGTSALPGGTSSITCTLARHHCPLTARSATTIRKTGGRVNMAVLAWTPSHSWHGGDRLALDCAPNARGCDRAPTNSSRHHGSGRTLQTGQLGIVQIGEHSARPDHATSTRIDDARLEINNSDYAARTVVHSARLDGLDAGDVISSAGSVEITGHGFDHFAGSYWVLANRPDKTTAATTGAEEYLSGRNGVNCLGAHGGLTATSSGYCAAPTTLPVTQDAIGTVARGAPSTMYLNYVVFASDGSRPAGVAPSADIDDGHFLIDCYSAPRAAHAEPCSIGIP